MDGQKHYRLEKGTDFRGFNFMLVYMLNRVSGTKI